MDISEMRVAGRKSRPPGGRKAYLWHEDEAEGARGAENDEDRYDDEGYVLLVGQNERNDGSEDAHDHHVVHAHPCTQAECLTDGCASGADG